jgi:hypothetical protein
MAALIFGLCGCSARSGGDSNGTSFGGSGGIGAGGAGPSAIGTGGAVVPPPAVNAGGPTVPEDSGPPLAPVPPDAGSDAGASGTSSAGADAGPRDAGAISDSGDAATSDAGASKQPSQAGDSACSGGMTWLASDAAGAGSMVTGYGELHFDIPTSTQIIGLQTTLIVPEKPATSSTLYAWPGIEPGRWDNIGSVGQGVLQPVLTWGTSCGDYAPKNAMGWWISPQYVNPYTSDPSVYGCMGGDALDVAVGDALDITISLKGMVWSQMVLDRQTQQKSTFDIDLMGQTQNWALFKIEMPTQNKPTSDIVFTSTILTFADPAPEACEPSVRGMSDYFAAPQSSPDGTRCCISRIVLRAQGVTATTPNIP